MAAGRTAAAKGGQQGGDGYCASDHGSGPPSGYGG
jgi:hypothetical protein